MPRRPTIVGPMMTWDGPPPPPTDDDPNRQCTTECSCRGMLRAIDCKTMPGCDSCSHWEAVPAALAGILDQIMSGQVPGHVVGEAMTPLGHMVVVHLHPGESLHDAVRREAEVPRWMN